MFHSQRVPGTFYPLLLSVLLRACLALWLAAPTTPVRAQDAPAPGEAQPLQTLLNQDGTMNLSGGFQGALDPAGYSMGYGADGQPVFTPVALSSTASAGDVNWDDRFTLPGTEGYIWAVAINGSDLYVGGVFHHCRRRERKLHCQMGRQRLDRPGHWPQRLFCLCPGLSELPRSASPEDQDHQQPGAV